VDIFLWCDKGGAFDDDETILTRLPCSWLPFLHLFTRPLAITVRLVNTQRRCLDGPFSPFLYLAVASPSA